MPHHEADIIPIIPITGEYNHLWPLSRDARPHSLLPLINRQSSFSNMLQHFKSLTGFGSPVILATSYHARMVSEQVDAVGLDCRIMLVDDNLHSHAAMCAAVRFVEQANPDATVLIQPADHIIRSRSAFLETCETAYEETQVNNLVAFAFPPTCACPRHPYIRLRGDAGASDPISEIDDLRHAETMKEAARYVADDYMWFTGCIMARANELLHKGARPEHMAALDACLEPLNAAYGLYQLRAKVGAHLPSPDLALGVQDPSSVCRAVVVTYDWSDIGSWRSVHVAADQDRNGNAVIGDVMLRDVNNSLIMSESVPTTVVGLDDVYVVVSEDGVLVCSRAHLPDLAQLQERSEVAE